MRAEMGYPIIVTPVSQFIATQAFAQRDRRRALDQRLRRDGPLLPRPLRRACRRRPIPRSRTACSRCRRRGAPRRAALQPRRRTRAASAQRISDEELLLRLTMPAEQVDAISRATPSDRRAPAAARHARSSAPARARAPAESISYLRVQKGDDLVVWRRALLTASAASSSTSTARWSTGRARGGARAAGSARGARPDRGVRPPVRPVHERQPPAAGRVRAAAARRRAAGRGRAGAHAAVLRSGIPAPRRCASSRSRASRRARTSTSAGMEMVDDGWGGRRGLRRALAITSTSRSSSARRAR